MLGAEVTTPVRRRGPARRHHRHHAHRLGRPVASGRSCRAASRCGWTATPTTTSARACPAAGSSCALTARRSAPRTTSSPATTSLRRHGRRAVHPRPGRRAVLRPQLRRHRGRRGRRRPRLRVHDRRPGGRARRDRAQRRGRHERRHRLRPRPRPVAKVNREMVDLEPLDDGDRDAPARCSSSAPRADRLAGRRRSCSTTGRPAAASPR